MAESITEERAAITLETSDHRKGNTVREDGWTDRWELQSVSSTSGLVSGGSDADLLFGQSVVLFVGDQPQSSLVSALWRPQQLWQRAAAHWRPASCLHPSDLYNNSQLSVFVSRSTCCSTLIWTEIFCVTSIKKLVKWAFIKCSICINQINLVESTSNSSFCTLDYKLLLLLFIKHNNFKLYSCFFITKLRSGQKHGRKCLIKFVPSQIPTPHFLSLCFLFRFLCVAFTSVLQSFKLQTESDD